MRKRDKRSDRLTGSLAPLNLSYKMARKGRRKKTMSGYNVGRVLIEDNEGSYGSARFYLGPVTALNYDAKLTAIDDVADAVAAVTIGKVKRLALDQDWSVDYPHVTNPNAQRETKWLVSYRDTTEFLDVANTIANPGFEKVLTMEIPCADLTLLRPRSEEMDIDTPGSPGANLKAALEANVRTLYNLNSPNASIEVLSIKYVSRNS